MLTTAFAAGAATLSLLINGINVHATYIQSERDGCDTAHETALAWGKRAGVHPVKAKLDGWCTVGAVIADQWVSEQWRIQRVNGKTSGWRIVMPLAKNISQDIAGQNTPLNQQHLDSRGWHLDVVDPQIATRIRYRQSLQNLDLHHQESQRSTAKQVGLPASKSAADYPLRLSRHRNGEVLMSGRHPDGGSYSILIERGIEK